MDKTAYRVTITTDSSSSHQYIFHATNLNEFKQKLLKRFNNIFGSTDENKEKARLKHEIKVAKYGRDIKLAFIKSHWTLKIETFY